MDTLQPVSAQTAGHILLELVVDTAAGARAAAENGADRIELCAGLTIGGLTPPVGLMRLAAATGCPTRAMIRPRGGDFLYSRDEVDLMLADIDSAAAGGMTGVVFGANLDTGELDKAVLARLCRHADAQGLDTAIHRSFDLTPDPLAALDTVIGLGMKTILTSGGARTARDGVDRLAQLVSKAAGRIEILAGIGVTAGNAAEIIRLSGVRSVHSSCSAPAVAAPETDDNRGWLLGHLRSGQRDTAPGQIKAMRQALDSIELTVGNGGRT